MTISRTITHIEAKPRGGRVEFRIDIDERATVTADAASEEAQEIVAALEEEPRDSGVAPRDGKGRAPRN